MNKIEVFFIPCTPTPERGYFIGYRVAGTTDTYTNAGYFFASPAIFYDRLNPAETCYEGYIRTDCGVLGIPDFWESCGSSGTVPTHALNWEYANHIAGGGNGSFEIKVNGTQVVLVTTSSGAIIMIPDGATVRITVIGEPSGDVTLDLDTPAFTNTILYTLIHTFIMPSVNNNVSGFSENPF